jgi:FdhD protein
MTISTPSTSESPDTPSRDRRRGRGPELALVDEVPVWLEVNGTPTVTWMCTPEMLEELAVGWLHGEGYISSRRDLLALRPCAADLGFRADVCPERASAARQTARAPVLASGCGAVSLATLDPTSVSPSPPRGPLPPLPGLRQQFKELFAAGARYQETGGIHAAALSDGCSMRFHAEDIGRHNAVDKVIGAALLADLPINGLGLLVTGRISAELAVKAARGGLAWVATPSVPSTLADTIARRAGMTLIGRAVSGTPQVHRS